MTKESKGVALVTGAARRIGRAIALGLAENGYDVALHCRTSRAEAEETARAVIATGRRASVTAADLADAAAIPRLVAEAAAKTGPLSLLVNSASEFAFDSIETLDAAQWDRVMAINLRAPVLLAQAFARQVGSGAADPSIVNLVDQRVLRPEPDYFSYGVSKSALHAATQMLAQALAPRIRVNGVAPGPTIGNQFQSEADFEAERRATLLGAGSPPEEIVRATLYLAAAKSVTGATLVVDGGQHLAPRR